VRRGALAVSAPARLNEVRAPAAHTSELHVGGLHTPADVWTRCCRSHPLQVADIRASFTVLLGSQSPILSSLLNDRVTARMM